MNDSEIMATGELCEALLVSHQFQTVVAQYEMTIAADMLATKPEDKARREELYASLWGTRGLLEYMKLNAKAAATIRYPDPPVTTEDINDYDFSSDEEPRDEYEEF